MDLRHMLFLWQSLGKESRKGLDPLISEFRAYRVWGSKKSHFGSHFDSKNLSRLLLTSKGYLYFGGYFK